MHLRWLAAQIWAGVYDADASATGGLCTKAQRLRDAPRGWERSDRTNKQPGLKLSKEQEDESPRYLHQLKVWSPVPVNDDGRCFIVPVGYNET